MLLNKGKTMSDPVETYQKMIREIYSEGDAEFFNTSTKSFLGNNYQLVHNLSLNTWFRITPASGSIHERIPESEAMELLNGSIKTEERQNGVRTIL